MVSIARKNLFKDLPRFIVAQAGIMFAVGLVTIQTGLLNGFTRSSSMLISSANADLWLASKDIRHLDFTLPIPYKSLKQAQQVEGVERAEALITQSSVLRYGDKGTGAIAPIRIIGFDPNGSLFRPSPKIQGDWTSLGRPYNLFVDQVALKSLDIKGIGETAEIGAYRGQITGLTRGIQSIVSSPYVFTSLTTAKAFLTSAMIAPQAKQTAPAALEDQDRVTYILIRAKPGVDLVQLKRRLEVAVPNTKALTQSELTTITQTYWRDGTGVGFILGLGAVVGVIVGTVVVGQILYTTMGPAGITLAMTGHERVNLAVTLVSTGSLLLVGPFAADHFGSIGVAAWISIMLVARNIASLWMVHRLLGINVITGSYQSSTARG